jgi:hypothetical protein
MRAGIFASSLYICAGVDGPDGLSLVIADAAAEIANFRHEAGLGARIGSTWLRELVANRIYA